MSTLLLKLAGPLQSWDTSSKYNLRMSGREPSKSGVIGLIAAAMGRGRDESISDISSLKFGVRIDQEGKLLHDFHTAHSTARSYVTHRYYLADAVFLVGLEGDEKFLKSIESALRSPVYPLFLGRRSCPPAGEICLGIRNGNLISSLKNEGWLAAEWYKKKLKYQAELEFILDSEDNDEAPVRDNPISFSQKMRQHSFRTVNHDIRGCVVNTNPEMDTDIDVFNIMEGE